MIPLLKVRAVLPKFAIAQRLWEHSTIKQLEQVPLSSTALSLEIPEDPALSAGLESIKLDLDVSANAILPILRPRVDSPGLAVAGANVRRAGETTLHARARGEAVEVLGAVSESARPLADDDPLVGCCVVVDRVACQTQMPFHTHSDKPSIEDLILMVIDDDTLRVVVLRCKEAVHPARLGEAIVKCDWRVADLA